MKVYELAKQINVPSSDIVKLLQENDISIKCHMANLDDDVVEMVKANYIQPVNKKMDSVEQMKTSKKDADYKPDEMIPCRSLFPGVFLFSGDHTHMVYPFNGPGDRRNVEYQDLKAAMIQHKGSIFNPDIIIEDENLINDDHWFEVKDVYESMFNEEDIQKVMNLPNSDFETAFIQLPIIAKNRIIGIYATQMENGTFEHWNKAKIIDKVCGTRFDLKM